MTPIRLLQTAAGKDYLAMLHATEPLHRRFAERHGAEYIKYEGVVRGWWDWQATFNRIDLIGDMLDAGYRGWVLYVDADAVIRDPAFPIRAYLAEHAEHALIAVSGTGQADWDINAGVFFLNLADARGRTMVERWREAFHRQVTDAMLTAAERPWQPLPDGNQFPDDQHLLQMVMYHDAALLAGLHLEQASFMNYTEGSFIRQVIREQGGNRAAQVAAQVADVEAAAKRHAPRLAALAGGDRTPAARLAGQYEALVGARRRDRFTLLRVGPIAPTEKVSKGLPVSLSQWLEYLPHADIVSIDRENRAALQRSRLFLHQVDPANLAAVTRIAAATPRLRIVIDASGDTADGKQMFAALFGLVAPGGWHMAEGAAVDALTPLLRDWIETGRSDLFGKDHADLVTKIGSIHFLRVGPGERAIAIRRRDA